MHSQILKNIVQIRNNKGFTQEYMANKMGIKQSSYSLIENGSRGLQVNVLYQIAIILDMDIIDLIKYPDKYEKVGTHRGRTKIFVEVEVSNEEFAKYGLKNKILQVIE